MTGAALRPVLLAAGRSTRFQDGFKLLEPVAGEPVVVRSLRALFEAGLGRPLVVTGSRAADVTDALKAAFGDVFDAVPNPRFAEGMATSIAVAARAVPDGSPLLLALADMPLVGAALHAAVARALDPDDPGCVARARSDSQPGHPVAFGSGWLPELRLLEGDRGAAPLLKGHPVRWVEVDPATQIDVDTREALDRANAIAAASG